MQRGAAGTNLREGERDSKERRYLGRRAHEIVSASKSNLPVQAWNRLEIAVSRWSKNEWNTYDPFVRACDNVLEALSRVEDIDQLPGVSGMIVFARNHVREILSGSHQLEPRDRPDIVLLGWNVFKRRRQLRGETWRLEMFCTAQLTWNSDFREHVIHHVVGQAKRYPSRGLRHPGQSTSLPLGPPPHPKV